jgi:hypothetical protein
MRVLIVVLMLFGVAGAQEAAWTAKWIQAPWSTERDGAELDGSKPLPVFRREFEVRSKVQHAELRIAGLGQFHADIAWTGNLRLLGPKGLHEAWTDYRKTIRYESYDVTAMMPVGPHVISVMLGNGMYNVQKSLMANGKARYTKFDGSFGAPKLIAELQIMYADGTSQLIASDASWKCARGPVLFSSIYGGEDFDARKELPGLSMPGFKDAGWDAAEVVNGPGGKLTKASAPEVAEDELHTPVKTTDVGGGRTVYDLGQNFAGVVHVQVKGPVGGVLRLTPGELLKPDGTVSQASSAGPMWWSYTLMGTAHPEGWEPQFGYYGFRYVQAEWVGASGQILNLSGIGLHSAAKVTGTFESSNDMLNAIHRLIVEAMHNNEMSIFTDCPHREKLGWLEETHIVASGLMFNNDLRGLYAATDQNIADAQYDDGEVPTTAPRYTVFGGKNSVFDDSPEWGSASVLAPWAAYRFYGDKAQLEKDYPVMQRYVSYLESRAKDGIVAYGLGDWYDIGPKPPGVSQLTSLGVTGTLMLYEDAAAMSRIAGIIGKDDDQAKYAALAASEKAAFNAKYFDAAEGFYDKGSQTAQAMPLALGIVPEEAKAKVLAKLVEDIHAHQDHITTGEIGYPYLVRVLMENGQNDLLMAMMMRTDPPSYGSQLAAGATSLTEAWDANPKSSQDHFMLGGAEEWFYRGLGGIDFDMTRKADERITIRPQVVEGLDWVKCGYDSAMGKIESDWKRASGTTIFEVAVPIGAKATVVLPGSTQVVGSGVHRFTVKDKT